MRPSLLLLLIPLLLTGCGGTTAGTGGGATAGDDSLAAASGGQLTVQVDPGDGSPSQTWMLTCNGAGAGEGTHPRAEAACERLQSMDAPFAPLPDDLVCTEIYGGPQTARVSGRWKGQPVDLALSRSNGCLMSQWDSLVPVVPAAG